MPTVEQNTEEWGSRFDWSLSGDDWSASWGGTENLWWGTLHPRVRAFLPAAHVLEIAPGYGRVTQFLHPRCDRLTVVDLNETCISACRQRFADVPHITYHVNDGRSLAAVEDSTVDFALSFDSLVHADADVIEGYLKQLATKLTADGVALLHHSNAGAYLAPLRTVARRVHADHLAEAVCRRVNRSWRAEDVSSARFAALAERSGLRCSGQEVISWHSRFLNDCFSTVTLPGSRWDRSRRVSRNRNFMAEVDHVHDLGNLYGPDSFGSG